MKKFNGLKNVINQNNEKSLMAKMNLRDHIFCIIVYIGKIENNGQIIIKEKCKNFTNGAFVKQDLMKEISNVMNPFFDHNKLFASPFNSKLFGTSHNFDNFYFDDSVNYSRKPNEFVILTLAKMYNRIEPGLSYWHDFVDPHAFFDEEKEIEQRTNIQKYVYKILENSESGAIGGISNKSTHEHCIDIVPLDYIVLKPIVPFKLDIENNSKFRFIDEKIKTKNCILSVNQNTKSSLKKFNELQFVHHDQSIMKFITHYQGLGKQPENMEFHEMENPTNHLNEISNFIRYALKKQSQIVQKNLSEIASEPIVWNRFISMNTLSDNIYKKVSTLDFLNNEYIYNFGKCGIKLDLSKENVRKGGESYEKEVIL